MKNLKKYWKMIVTAVICFLTGVFHKTTKNKNTSDMQNITEKNKVFSAGTDAMKSQNCRAAENSNQAAVFSTRSRNRLLRDIFFWLQGPGDIPGQNASGVFHRRIFMTDSYDSVFFII